MKSIILILIALIALIVTISAMDTENWNLVSIVLWVYVTVERTWELCQTRNKMVSKIS